MLPQYSWMAICYRQATRWPDGSVWYIERCIVRMAYMNHSAGSVFWPLAPLRANASLRKGTNIHAHKSVHTQDRSRLPLTCLQAGSIDYLRANSQSFNIHDAWYGNLIYGCRETPMQEELGCIARCPLHMLELVFSALSGAGQASPALGEN